MILHSKYEFALPDPLGTPSWGSGRPERGTLFYPQMSSSEREIWCARCVSGPVSALTHFFSQQTSLAFTATSPVPK